MEHVSTTTEQGQERLCLDTWQINSYSLCATPQGMLPHEQKDSFPLALFCRLAHNECVKTVPLNSLPLLLTGWSACGLS